MTWLRILRKEINCLLIIVFINSISLYPFFEHLLSLINIQILNDIFYIIFLIFLADLIISLKIISNIKLITTNIIKDNTEEVSKKVKDKIVTTLNSFKKKINSPDKKIRKVFSQQPYFTKRIIEAFPKFKVSNILKKKSKGDK